LDVDNPYKRIGGGSLDQALFKKRQPQSRAGTHSPARSEPPQEKPAASGSPTPVPATEHVPTAPAERLDTPARKAESPPKRAFIKRTFDLYEDQLAYLTKESLQDRLAGKEGSMNAMVREAIDDWIRRRKAGK
jgi:hypothetical protein